VRREEEGGEDEGVGRREREEEGRKKRMRG
jgi:hypothetical protein